MMNICPTFRAHLCDPSKPIESGVLFDVPVITQDLRGLERGVMSGPLFHCISEGLVSTLL